MPDTHHRRQRRRDSTVLSSWVVSAACIEFATSRRLSRRVWTNLPTQLNPPTCEFYTLRRRDSTRQLSRVGGVYLALHSLLVLLVMVFINYRQPGSVPPSFFVLVILVSFPTWLLNFVLVFQTWPKYVPIVLNYFAFSRGDFYCRNQVNHVYKVFFSYLGLFHRNVNVHLKWDFCRHVYDRQSAL